MGAGQSSANAPSAAAAPAAEVKRSYYELLSVERIATDDELKKAYRRKALELHPDRNYGAVEETTKLFAEVQTAYEILSDPQERAWYDSHEAAILRGGEAAQDAGEQFEYNTKVTSADDLVRVMSRFNKNVEFSDAPSGFYGYLREIFEQLAKEEEIAAEWEKVDIPEYPPFGHADDEYNDVVKQFYQVWIGFSTRKTFAWKDKFRLSEAPDRQYRRAMEKENKKLREEGQREFNDAVRALVAFVRKRDPRYTPNTQTEAERQKILRDAAAAQAARARAANAAQMQQEVPAWAVPVEKDEHEGEITESESEEEHYECVACRKTFKSEKQWDAHEKSKKHQKAVFALQKKMRKDNAKLNLNSTSVSGADTPLSDEDDELLEEETVPILVDSDAEAAEQIHHMTVRDTATNTKSRAKRTKTPKVKNDNASEASKSPVSHDSSDEEDTDNDEYASPEDVKALLASRLDNTPIPKPGSTKNDDISDVEDIPQQTKPKLGAAAKKRAKKAAAAASALEPSDSKFGCAMCDATFPSRSKMHQHIKDLGHAAPKTLASAGGGKGKKGKR
ncbi:hypothetical protein AAFC00_006541 [Neodothiora populina]|uniref:DnaJ-domain-containing protein n=1 Tax=Neodothiora populina TaxID=2781224 RepID=A0ABR3PBH5_9PEZI